MQNPSRVYEKDLKKFLYPPREEYEREINIPKSPIITKNFSYSTNEFINKKPNLSTYYHYDDEHQSPSSYIMNKELNRNALGYPKDENQFSVLDNNYSPFQYSNDTYRQEGKIYHYSVASRKDYSRDKEEDNYSSYYYPENKSRKYYIEKRTTPFHNEKNYYSRRNEQNILPTKVYISDSYLVNKSEPSKFRPSREKDGYKGGIVNLKRQYYSNGYDINSIILIQRWWRNILRRISSRYEYQYYPSVTTKKTYSRRNKKIREEIIPGENDKIIVQTTRVEVLKSQYMNKPVLKPEIISKESKISQQRNKNIEINNDIEIALDKYSLKQHMINIWNEENMLTSAESLSIIQNESYKTTLIKKMTINDYEEQIKQLKIALSKSQNKLNEANNKIKSLTSKKMMENIYMPNIENNLEVLKYENYLKKEDIAILRRQNLQDDNLKIQLVDELFIKNYPISRKYRNEFFYNKKDIIENYNLEIIPIPREPLKKQLVDSLYIENQDENIEEGSSPLRRGKIKLYTFGPEKTLIEEKDSIEILPIEKGPLKKQLVDNLFIERIFYEKPENTIQNIDKIAIFRIPRIYNIPEKNERIELLPVPKEPLKGQIVDSLYIEGLVPTKMENIIQNVDKLIIFKSPKPLNIIETRDMMEIQSLEKEPLQKQLVDDLYIERLISQKSENKIQNINRFCIFKKQRPLNIIEPKDNIEIFSKEREQLKGQLIDSLNIEGLPLIESENIIQKVDKLTIFRTQRPKNIVESREYIEILPREREPLQKQLVDDLYIEKIKYLKPNNMIQNTEKLSIFRVEKQKNIIEIIDNIQISSLEREPLQKQIVDNLYVEKIISLKPENKIQNRDKLSIFKTPRSLNVIDSNENLEILPIEKEPLKKQLVDSLYIEKIKISPIHKDLIVENFEGMEILNNNEKKPLLYQQIDSIYVDGEERPNNKIEQTSLITILRKAKNPNTIEWIQELFISAKGKPELYFQIVDELLIEGKERDEILIEECENFEIINTQRKLRQKNKQLNFIQQINSIELSPIEKEPLKKQIVDNIIIEEIPKKDNEIQVVDKIDILKVPKPLPKNIIEEKDSIFLEQIEKEPLINKTVDNILIEGSPRQDNLIQNVDKLNILKIPKPENIIELNDNIFIAPKEKESLQKQLVDDLIILPNKKSIVNLIQFVDKIEILRAPRPENIMEQNEEFLILPKQKEPLKNEIIDNILIEGNLRQDNLIQWVDKIEILKTPKPENVIELNDNIFIAPKQKESLKNQLVDNILIEGNIRQDNAIQNNAKIEILKSPKFKNIIEENVKLFISSEEKEPLLQQVIDVLAIEGDEIPENEIQVVDKIEILKTRAPKSKNIIEENDTLFIPANEKEKQEMKNQIVDNILIEGINRPNNEIQILDKINILKSPKPDNLLVGIDRIFIGPEEREELILQICDELLIEPIERTENQIQKFSPIEILKTAKTPKEENIIEQNYDLFILPKEKDPLKNQIVDNIKIEGNLKQNNQIQNVDIMEIIKIPKPENIIQENGSMFIPPKEKESLLSQIIDNIIIEGNLTQYKEIQNVDKIEILKAAKPKPENIIEFKDSIFIESKEHQPLQCKVYDSLLIEGNLKPNNSIQLVEKMEILKHPKPQNIIQTNDYLFISSKEKEPLQIQLIDKLLIEKEIKPNISQSIDKIELLGSQRPKIENIIQQNDDLFIPPKEKTSFNIQNIDSLKIEGILKVDNKIESDNKIEILRTVKPKPINKIEINNALSILSREKEPYVKQSMDKLFIEKTQRPDNAVQKLDEIQIIRKSKKNKNIIDQNVCIEILPKKVEKEPLQNINVDNIKIEGNPIQNNEIQNMDKFDILRTEKPKTKNIIEQKENIFIEPKQKVPLDKESVDSILIGSQPLPENNIQTNDAIQLAGTFQKCENKIESLEKLFIPPKEKAELFIEWMDELNIDEIEKPENKIQTLNKLDILGTINPKPQNKIEQISNIFIPPKENEALKNELVDKILIEGIERKDNEIQNGDKFDIFRTAKPKLENKIELKDQIFIESQQKEPLEYKVCDTLLIEGVNRPETQIEKKDEIKIVEESRPPKQENIIELKDTIFIEPKEKEPLECKVCDKLFIEGINKPEIQIEKKDEIKIEEEPKPQKQENVIEEGSNLFIKSKKREPLQNKTIDKILIEGNYRIENQIENIDKILLSEKPKSLNEIDQNINVLITPKEKEPLSYQQVDILKIENEKQDYSIEKQNQMQLIYSKIDKKLDNQIEDNCNFLIESKKKDPLQYQITDTIKVEGIKLMDNQIQQIESFKYSENQDKSKNKSIIEGSVNLEIISIKKEIPLKKQLIDSILIKEIKPNNKIQLNIEFEILKSKKHENLIEPECNFYIIPKKKKPLEYQRVDDLFIDRLMPIFSGDKNIIENSQILELSSIKEKNEIPIEDSKEKLRGPKSVEKSNIIPLSVSKQELQFERIEEGSKQKLRTKPSQEKPKNEIQNTEKFEIIKENKIENILPNKKEEIKEDKMDEFNIEGMTRPENAIDLTKKLKIINTSNSIKIPNEIRNQDKFFIPPKKKELLLEYSKNKDIYIEGTIKKLENQIQSYNFEIPKTIEKQKKSQNIITRLDEYHILSKGKEKIPLVKENIDKIGLINKEDQNEIPKDDQKYILKNKKLYKNEITYLDKFFFGPKEKEPLIRESIDEFDIEAEKRPDNAIETIKKLQFLKPAKPKNEINNIKGLSIISEENKKIKYNNEIQNTQQFSILKSDKKEKILSKENNEQLFLEGKKLLSLPQKREILTLDKIDELKIEGEKIVQKVIPENSIQTQEPLLIKSQKKPTLLNIESKELHIEGIKILNLAKKIQYLEENKINDIYLKGKEDIKFKPLNQVKNEKELFIEGKKKEPLIEEKVINDLNIKGITKEIIPLLTKQKLEISYKDKIYIQSKNNGPIIPNKLEPIFIQGIEKKGEIKIKKVENEIERVRPIYISSQKRPSLKKQLTTELNIGNEEEEKSDSKKLLLKGKRIKFTTVQEENKEKFTILGQIKPQQNILSIKKENNIKENKDSFFIKGLDKSIAENEEYRELKFMKLKKPYEEISQAESLTLNGNKDPEFYEEFYIFRKKYKKLKEEIKPNHEKSLFIQGEPKSEAKIIQKSECIPSKYQKNVEFTLFGTQKKPYIIENKGCFNIISCDSRAFKNKLLVQGIHFGLFGNKNEPGRMAQDIENINLLKFRNKWKEANQAQRTYFIDIPGNNKKWNECSEIQRCVNFPINKTRQSLDLQKIKEIDLNIINQKEILDEINKDDYNYISLEKDEKQRRTVKATISKVYREKSEDDEDPKELDPFSSCRKHSGRKYDKLFKERKTTSLKIQDDNDRNLDSILNKGDEERKAGTLILKDIKGKKGEKISLKEGNEKKNEPFKNIISKKKEIETNKFKDIGKSKTQIMFKSKEKKTEYLRDYDNELRYYN